MNIFSKKQIYYFIIILMISLSSLYFKNEIHYKNFKIFEAVTNKDYKFVKDFFNKENIRVRIRVTKYGKNENGTLSIQSANYGDNI